MFDRSFMAVGGGCFVHGRRGLPELLFLKGRAAHERDGAAGKGGEERESGTVDERHVGEVEREWAALAECAFAGAIQLSRPRTGELTFEVEGGAVVGGFDGRDAEHFGG